MYVCFVESQSAYGKVNEVLRMYDISGKLLSVIKRIYVDSLALVKVKEGQSECFRIDTGVRQG